MSCKPSRRSTKCVGSRPRKAFARDQRCYGLGARGLDLGEQLLPCGEIDGSAAGSAKHQSVVTLLAIFGLRRLRLASHHVGITIELIRAEAVACDVVAASHRAARHFHDSAN